jgi:hypothetical protein
VIAGRCRGPTSNQTSLCSAPSVAFDATDAVGVVWDEFAAVEVEADAARMT